MSSSWFRCPMLHLHLCLHLHLHLTQRVSTLNLSRRTPAAPGPKPVIQTLLRFAQIAQLLTQTLQTHHPNLWWHQRNLMQCHRRLLVQCHWRLLVLCHWRLLVQHQRNLQWHCQYLWILPLDLQQHQGNIHWRLKRQFLVAPVTVPKIYWIMSPQGMGLAWALSIQMCWCS